MRTKAGIVNKPDVCAAPDRIQSAVRAAFWDKIRRLALFPRGLRGRRSVGKTKGDADPNGAAAPPVMVLL